MIKMLLSTPSSSTISIFFLFALLHLLSLSHELYISSHILLPTKRIVANWSLSYDVIWYMYQYFEHSITCKGSHYYYTTATPFLIGYTMRNKAILLGWYLQVRMCVCSITTVYVFGWLDIFSYSFHMDGEKRERNVRSNHWIQNRKLYGESRVL